MVTNSGRQNVAMWKFDVTLKAEVFEDRVKMILLTTELKYDIWIGGTFELNFQRLSGIKEKKYLKKLKSIG